MDSDLFELILGMFNCIVFSTVASLKRGGMWSSQSTLTRRIFFAPVPSWEYLSFVCVLILFRFHFHFTFMLLKYIEAPVSLYLCLMLFLSQLQPTKWCEGFFVVHWRPKDGFERIFFFILVKLLSLCHIHIQSPYRNLVLFDFISRLQRRYNVRQMLRWTSVFP